ncbi:hypothetical protein [Lacticaseibacillus daqingensis]|uniref:hypothetical protein n=1 Tax=Lacticaseibacillus daqingensis TaxID=2486014 RepID=UPI000F784263|nr:hypothetical protein [Lacticaseibacillus daqingensis]
MREDEQRALRWLEVFTTAFEQTDQTSGLARQVLTQLQDTDALLATDRYSGFGFNTEYERCLRTVTRALTFDELTLGPAAEQLWRTHPIRLGQRWDLTDPEGRFDPPASSYRPTKHHFWQLRKHS